MPLNPAQLQQSLYRVLTSKDAATALPAANNMAAAYAEYAQMAMAGTSIPVFTGVEKELLSKTLFAAIATTVGASPPKLAVAWSTGLVAFWSAPPIVFGPVILGVTTSAASIPAIVTPGLTACFANLANTPEICSATMAAILDSATRTVLVTLTLPPPASPITVPLV